MIFGMQGRQPGRPGLMPNRTETHRAVNDPRGRRFVIYYSASLGGSTAALVLAFDYGGCVYHSQRDAVPDMQTQMRGAFYAQANKR
jgi:hypothetical protein